MLCSASLFHGRWRQYYKPVSTTSMTIKQTNNLESSVLLTPTHGICIHSWLRLHQSSWGSQRLTPTLGGTGEGIVTDGKNAWTNHEENQAGSPGPAIADWMGLNKSRNLSTFFLSDANLYFPVCPTQASGLFYYFFPKMLKHFYNVIRVHENPLRIRGSQ